MHVSLLGISVFEMVVIFHAVIDKHIVKYKDHEVHNLNELEFIKGEVWANVYQVTHFTLPDKSISNASSCFDCCLWIIETSLEIT